MISMIVIRIYLYLTVSTIIIAQIVVPDDQSLFNNSSSLSCHLLLLDVNILL